MKPVNTAACSLIILCNTFLVGCNSTHNPDSVIIESNSWNRKKLMDGMYVINVRGTHFASENMGITIGNLAVDSETFVEVEKLFNIAVTQTCPQGLKKVFHKKQFVNESQSVSTFFYINDKPVGNAALFYEPWITGLIHCEGSKVTLRDLEAKLKGEEVPQTETSSKFEQDFDAFMNNNN